MTRPWIERTDNNPSQHVRRAWRRSAPTARAMEQPLLAAKLALTDRIADGKNAGFVRDDALLAVVILTDEDDQSDDPTCDERDPGRPTSSPPSTPSRTTHARWATVVTAGPGPASASSAFGSPRRRCASRTTWRRPARRRSSRRSATATSPSRSRTRCTPSPPPATRSRPHRQAAPLASRRVRKSADVPAHTPRPHRACGPWRRVKPSQSPPTAACSSSRAR